MPGLVGLISQRPPTECAAVVEEMIGSMLHEPFYLSGTCHAAELGVYGGWVAHKDSFAATESGERSEAGVSVVFSGECYSNKTESIANQYLARREAFIPELNGLFAGMIIDRMRGAAFLFNDRYGFDRVYVAEAKDEIYFASEAKALLAVLPGTREFDPEGLADFLAMGCTINQRTLFRGISLLPAASCWTVAYRKLTKSRYFDVSDWENQDRLDPSQFAQAFEETIENCVPKYYAGNSGRLGISLTAGLDSRVVLAARPVSEEQPICYTYDGVRGETLDGTIAGKVATAAGYRHQLVRLKEDFFSEFSTLADRTAYLTDGTLGPTGAHELYLSRAARALAPVRLTGVFGGEIFRGVSTFKGLGLDQRLLEVSLAGKVETQTKAAATVRDHPVTQAAFKEIPWSIFGSVASCRSQLSFRTPYIDNALVALAYRMPEELRRTPRLFESFLRRKAPTLANIPTDMGLLGKSASFSRFAQKTLAKATFKLDYLCNDGMPHWIAAAEPKIEALNARVRLHGRHKYLSYRRWFRLELSGYLRDALASSSVQKSGLWNTAFLGTLAQQHISGRANVLQEINAVLTLDAIERRLFSATASEPNRAAALQPA